MGRASHGHIYSGVNMVAEISSRRLLVDNDLTRLPFLYLTRTLIASYHGRRFVQCCQYSTKSSAVSAVRNQPENSPPSAEPPPDPKDHVPRRGLVSLRRLVNVERPDDQNGHQRRSTITSAERRAFQSMVSKLPFSPKFVKTLPGSFERRNVRKQLRAEVRMKKVSAAQAEISDAFMEIVRALRQPPATCKKHEARAEQTTELNVEQETESLAESREPDMDKENRHEQSQQRDNEQEHHSRTHSRSEHLLGTRSTIGTRIERRLREFRDMQVNSEGRSPFELGPLTAEVAERETKKICQAMDDCITSGKGDIGIWKICETHVFPMLNLVKPEELEGSLLTRSQVHEALIQSFARDKNEQNTKEAARSHTNVGLSTPKQTDTIETNPSTHDSTSLPPIDIPPNVSTIAVLVAVYPEVLVYALQSLRKHYASSPFSAQLHDAVKSP